jgi:hypothetical protein
VRTAIKEYLKLDEARRRNLHSNGDEAYLYQPSVNYRTLEFDKAQYVNRGANSEAKREAIRGGLSRVCGRCE